MIVFHASTVSINEFYMPYGGLHFGGMMSAIQCSLRHLYEEREKGSIIDTIYIHRCFIDDVHMYDGTDAGNNIGWQKQYIQAQQEDTRYNCIKYTNQYEPDILPSYCLFDLSKVQILDCSTMHMDTAEDILCGIYTDEYRYSY